MHEAASGSNTHSATRKKSVFSRMPDKSVPLLVLAPGCDIYGYSRAGKREKMPYPDYVQALRINGNRPRCTSTSTSRQNKEGFHEVSAAVAARGDIHDICAQQIPGCPCFLRSLEITSAMFHYEKLTACLDSWRGAPSTAGGRSRGANCLTGTFFNLTAQASVSGCHCRIIMSNVTSTRATRR